MDQQQALALIPGVLVGYQPSPSSQVLPATVVQNGPRIDANGYPISYMNNVLVIQIGDGPGTMIWEPVNFPDGISQIIANPAP